MARKIIVGTGITAREFTVLESAAELSESARSWNAAIKEGGGIFGAVSLSALRTCEGILRSTNAEPTEDSPVDFAEQIAKLIRISKRAIDEGSADLAARHAWTAGVLWATAMMKWQWEVDALRGEKVAGGERNAAHATNARHAQQRARRLAKMAELVTKLGVDGAAAQCEADGMGPREAIKKQFYRWKKRDS